MSGNSRSKVLDALRGPLPFLGLLLLVLEGVCGVAVAGAESPAERVSYVLVAAGLFICALVAIARNPDAFLSGRERLEYIRILNERDVLMAQAQANLTGPETVAAPAGPANPAPVFSELTIQSGPPAKAL